MAAARKAACFESLENVAPEGIASQSSTAHLGVASRAVNGNIDPEYSHESCTHTVGEPNPWWSLLLPVVYRVTAVSITNRNVAGERINNAEILIGNSLESNGNPRCAVISSIPTGGTKTFNCTGMTGWMVTVRISTSYGILTMCELEVYGELAAPAPSLGAVVMARRVAVVQKKLCWSDALLYCREHYWDLLSVRRSREGWRRRLMGSSWFWMSGASMSYIYWKEQHIWQVTSPCGGVDSDDSLYWRNFPCGAHLYFVCLKEFEENGNRVEFYRFTRQ